MTQTATLLKTARQSLVSAQTALRAELSAYPTPISGCDAQYNALISEMRRVTEALAVLDTPYFVATPRQPDSAAKVESR
ncbi:MAG: hypothetical protein ACWA40_00925 [Planktomarina sp.]